MSTTTLDAGDTVDQSTRLRFENAWREGRPIPIEVALAEEGPGRLPTLEELVHIELEQSWKAGKRITTEEYVRRFPELETDPDRMRRIVQHELRVRYRFGDRPGVVTYQQRFPQLFADSSAVLALERVVSIAEGPEVGDRLGRYRLEGELGRGGFGLVWLARDESLERTVALKQMHAHIAEREDTRRRFFGEARVAARLEHPGVVPIYELGDSATGPFFAMKLVNGETLGDAILEFHARKGKDAPGAVAVARARLVEACLAVTRTMAFTHARGVIHRDIKPQNVILGAYGETMILDWGIAKALDEHDDTAPVDDDNDDSGRTRAGSVVGTPAYMAPEQARGEIHALDRRSDVFALGAMLYETLTGELPFPHVNSEEMLAAVGSLRPVERAPRSIDPAVPRALEAICLKALAKDPRDRYADAGELARDLERHLAGAPVSAHRETLAERAVRWARNHRTLVVTTGIALLLLFVGATIAAVMIDDERAQAREAEVQARASESNAMNARAAAEEARAAAEEARRAADAARRSADVDRESAEHHLYVASLALAHSAWRDGDIAGAERQLEATPEARRGWEWRYVMGLARGALRELASVPTYRLAADPSGASLARVAADGVIEILEDGTPRTRIETRGPIDELVLLADRVIVRSGATLRAYDRATRSATTIMSASPPPLRIARDRAGSRLARIAQPNLVTLHDAATLELLAAHQAHSGTYTNPDTQADEPAPAEDIGLTPGFERVVTLDLAQTLRATDLTSGALAWERALPALEAPELAVGALVVVSQDRRFGSRVTRYDSETGAVVEPPTDFERPVTALVAAPERDVFFAGTIDGAIHVVEAGVEVNHLRAHRAPVRDLVVVGSELVSAAQDGVRVWSPLRPQGEVDVAGYQIAFTRDGAWLDGVGEAHDRWTGEVLGGAGSAPAASDIADLVLVAGPDETLAVLVRDGVARVVERATGSVLELLPIQSVAATYDGTAIVFATPGLLRTWSTSERRFVRELPLDVDGSVTLLASRVGVLPVVRDRIGLSALDDDGRHAWFMPMERRGGALALSADGTRLAVVENGAVALRDARTGEREALFEIDHALPTALTFLPDGARLAVATDQRLELWDVARAREVMRLPLEDRAMRVVASHDGRSIGVALEDGRVCIFNASWPRD